MKTRDISLDEELAIMRIDCIRLEGDTMTITYKGEPNTRLDGPIPKNVSRLKRFYKRREIEVFDNRKNK